MMGGVGILNVGAGDTKLVFDPSKPDEVKRSAAIVRDMIRRGFVLLIEVGRDDGGEPLYRRAHDFDERTAEYIIAGPVPEQSMGAVSDEKPASAPRRKGARKAKQSTRVPADRVKAVAVARTAGG